MNFPLEKIANQLILVAQGYGAEKLDQNRLFEEYRLKEGCEIGHLWGLANQSMKQGFFKFELEQEYIRKHLPYIIEPKSFWKRCFTNWKNQ